MTRIAAAARSTNSRSASCVQAKIWIGSAVNDETEPVRVEARVHGGADHQQRRRLADRAREREDDAGRDAGDRARQHLLPDRLPLGGAQRQRALADRGRHGADRLARDDDHDRQHQQRERDAAGEHDAARGRAGRGR